MGQYHYLINLDKKQVVHPHQIGNGFKLHEQIGWKYSTATALVMLLASTSKDGGRGGGDFRSGHPFIGAWAGDRIAFVGDYGVADDLRDVDAALIYRQCHAACCLDKRGKKPAGWKQWTNISPHVRKMMAAEFGIRYWGEGWVDIVEEQGGESRPKLCPDLFITAGGRPNQPLK